MTDFQNDDCINLSGDKDDAEVYSEPTVDYNLSVTSIEFKNFNNQTAREFQSVVDVFNSQAVGGVIYVSEAIEATNIVDVEDENYVNMCIDLEEIYQIISGNFKYIGYEDDVEMNDEKNSSKN